MGYYRAGLDQQQKILIAVGISFSVVSHTLLLVAAWTIEGDFVHQVFEGFRDIINGLRFRITVPNAIVQKEDGIPEPSKGEEIIVFSRV